MSSLRTQVDLVDSTYYKDNKAPTVSSTLWFQDENIDPYRFNQYYPYQLLLLLVEEKNGGVVYKKTPWKFTLPISPQVLSDGIPIPTSVQATTNGIVENHGGAPFEDIILQGTTGVTPIKNSAEPKDPMDDTLLRTGQAIFAGSTAASFAAAQSLSTSLEGNIGYFSNLNQDLGEGDNNIIPESTGYYQARLLKKFIRSYLEIKKKNSQQVIDGISFNSKDLRLAFCVWKDESIYICSAINFRMQRDANSPLKYNYTLQLKVWGNISSSMLGNSPLANGYTPISRDPNYYSLLLTRLNAVTGTLQKVGDILKSIIQDPLNRIKEVTREVALFLKSAIGIGPVINDYPDTIKKEVAKSLIENWRTLSQSFNLPSPTPPLSLSNGIDKVLVNGILPPEINQIFNQIKPSDLPLKSGLRQVLESEKTRVNGLTRADFESKRYEVIKYLQLFTNTIGAGSDFVNKIYNNSLVNADKKTIDDQFDIIFSLNELILILAHLSANFDITNTQDSSMEYVAGLASKSQIPFNIPVSKRAIPFPYGTTLERLALQYLGNANRWHEIATLNNLRAPYIDEEGFSLPLKTNGNKEVLKIANADNLYVNQTIYVISNNQKKKKLRIVEIKKIAPNVFYIYTNSDIDLSVYRIDQKASLQAFLPNTVNSQKVIYIPDDRQPSSGPTAGIVKGIDNFDPLLQISGIDLLLDNKGDLVITNEGDFKYAYGMQNIVQRIKLALSTPQGTLLQHPAYGINVAVGQSTADVNPEDIAKSITQMFANDSTFTGVKAIRINKNGPVVEIFVSIGIAGLNDAIPIQVNVIR